VISDFQSGRWEEAEFGSVETFRQQWVSGARGPAPRAVDRNDVEVTGGYLERLPLAFIRKGLADCGEIWSHRRGAMPAVERDEGAPLLRRTFQMDGPEPPFASNDMLGHIEAFGAPAILCVWGLGVSEDIMAACRGSFKIYNSIDAPALRVPPGVSCHFDLVLTGSEQQSETVRERHPAVTTAVMPIGPEFASELTFRPLDLPKTYDVIYVAAAQPYKRHDILFNALSKLPRSLRTLCVCGYGEMCDALRRQVAELGISVEFIDPPGVPMEEVNRLMNQARLGVVCGVDDGAPAILTEYMLAGIPVLANNKLCCGLQYITPATGSTASADEFHIGIADMLDRLSEFSPRKAVIDNWTWPHSMDKLAAIIGQQLAR
jgi:glycosyltransferase involved in cell wall biosynthesis